jgi:hypothetical protein
MLMSFNQLQDHPNYEDDIVNPERNENYEVRPLNPLFEPQAEQNQEGDGDEPGEECSLNESHDKSSLIHFPTSSNRENFFSAQFV